MRAPVVIASPQNDAVKRARRLFQKKARDESGLFLCEGEHMASEAVRFARESVEMLFVAQNRADAYRALLEALPEGAEAYLVSDRAMEALSQVKAPQGVVAAVRKPAPAPLSALGDRILLLDDVQDPGNVGTMTRTLDAAGFTGLILTRGCADPFGDKALRATMGSVFRVPYRVTDDASGDLCALRQSGYLTVAAALDGEAFYGRGERAERLALVIGNEGAGVSERVKIACERRYALPMNGGAESLNAAVAAAILMYDFVNR